MRLIVVSALGRVRRIHPEMAQEMRHIVRWLVHVGIHIGTIALVLLVSGRPAAGQANDWLEWFPAFRIAGNLYYVGCRGLASYLVTTPRGHILINSDLEANVPMIRASVEKLDSSTRTFESC
jgi:metallo-beta-lactamase class B